ncbi:glycosyltransferase family 39 protein [Streptomyces sp. NPDC048172]|uniref:glycosyltransferase family 39 protein n=1 Tax=Streptomyces sp. NPDC048172 TaxID=3365505 RepID=UPI00371ACEE9
MAYAERAHVQRQPQAPPPPDPDEPRWARPALWAILALAAVLYLWDLSSLGHANSFYSAAVYSGTRSWKAFFYGALDSGSFITVDKPPFALWVMGLSCRVLGFGTWQMMLPMAAAGVASVALLHRMVRVCSGHAAATVAALVLALTPMTVAITRDNNPDPVLVLLMLLGAHGTLRAIRTGRALPLVGAAVAIGFAFNTKMLQAYIVLPALFLAYAVAAPGGPGRRARRLALAAVALVVSSGWWMVLVDRIPAGSRPFIGGSEDNTVWDLVIGYNGLGRVFGENGGAGGGPGGGGGGPGGGGGGPGGGGGFGGAAGFGRLFNDINGGQISWLIPFAALALVAGLVLRGRRPRTDLPRAALLLWGGWFVLHHLVFSLSEGTFHPYYVTAMAPGIAALCGAGGVALHRAFRHDARWAWALPVAVAGTAAWAVVLLGRTDGWNSWLRPAIAVVATLAVAALLVARFGTLRRAVDRRRLMTVAALASVTALLAGPSAYAVSTAVSSPDGAMNGTNPTAGPTAGPTPGNAMGMPGGGRPGGKGGPGGQGPSGGQMPSGRPGAPGGQAGKGGRPPSGDGAMGGGRTGGAMGGGLDSKALAYLKAHRDGATWLVAVADDQSASSAILASREPVASMGGWTGSDDAMPLARLKKLVEEGKLHYVQVGGGRARSDDVVDAWVKKHGTKVKAVDASLYRLDPSDMR